MNKPIRSISGIRGIVGKTITAIESYKTTLAFYNQYLIKYVAENKVNRVVVGRDSKQSGEEILCGVLSALKQVKIQPIYLGITSTPIVQWAIRDYHAIGGIMITASHNPIQYNGIKLFSRADNTVALLKPSEMDKIIQELNIMDKSLKYRTLRIKHIQLPEPERDVLMKYNYDVIEKIESIVGKGIVQSIENRNYKVVIDACAKDAAEIPKSFLLSLGIDERNIFVINNGKIENSIRPLEPIPENLNNLQKAIEKYNADIGFAFDPDQDRLVAMPLLSEEHTPLLAAKFLLELQTKRRKKLIKYIPVNLSSTNAWEEVAGQYNVKIIRTPVGEINVVESMLKYNSIFGAEGNGGVILSPVTYCRNSTVGMTLILCYMSLTGKSLKELETTLPKYFMLKTKISVKNPILKMNRIEKYYNSDNSVLSMNKIDGLKIFFYNNSWVHIRPSNTEPIIRIIAEGTERKEVSEIVNQVKEIL